MNTCTAPVFEHGGASEFEFKESLACDFNDEGLIFILGYYSESAKAFILNNKPDLAKYKATEAFRYAREIERRQLKKGGQL